MPLTTSASLPFACHFHKQIPVVDMDGDTDVLVGGNGVGPFSFSTSSSQMVWCNNQGGSDPTFVAHVLFKGVSARRFDVLVSPDIVHIIIAEQLEGGVQLKWSRSVRGLWMADAPDDLVMVGAVIGSTLNYLAIIPPEDSRNPAIVDFVAGTGIGVLWYRSDASSPTGHTTLVVMTGYVYHMDIADVDGEDRLPSLMALSRRPLLRWLWGSRWSN